MNTIEISVDLASEFRGTVGMCKRIFFCTNGKYLVSYFLVFMRLFSCIIMLLLGFLLPDS